METKKELPTTPIFDIDDLSFFRFYGLGLRHTELELGLKEAQSDTNCGDAVSLACYGREPKNWWELSFEPQLCAPFQEKVEQFILDSYNMFHTVTNHYNDAAFALLIRGNDARIPYDFGETYPLGKCGKNKFTSAQIMGLINTQNHQNDDREHAVYNTLMDLKALCQALKLKKIEELLEANPQWSVLINELITHYQNHTFLNKPYFLILSNLCNPSNIYLPELGDLPIENEKIKSILNAWIQEENHNQQKGSNTIKVLYQPDDFASMDAQSLSKRLCHYISNQNLEKVKQCIQFLSKTEFNPEKDSTLQNPLQIAAHGASTAILKAVYEFVPQLYDDLIENKHWTTPIFIAARYSKKENLDYLLSVRKLITRDSSFFNKNKQTEEHFFLGLAESDDPDSYEIMHMLASMQVGYGFESQFDTNELYGNSLSLITRMWGQTSGYRLDQKKFELLLPHANAKSKYLAILSATCELFYCYGGGPREKKEYESACRSEQLFAYRNQIFLSLTKKECEEIRAIARSGISYSRSAEQILIGDLKIEIEGNPDTKLVAAIQNCFEELNPSAKAEQIVLVQSTDNFFQNTVDTPVTHYQTQTQTQTQTQRHAEENSCCII
jgi:hypothetical protein